MTTAPTIATLDPVFEAPTERVKCLAFHPTDPWILCGTKGGEAQIWDYENHSIISTYSVMPSVSPSAVTVSSAVRGVDFHPSEPLFVTGDDSGHVKLWTSKVVPCYDDVLDEHANSTDGCCLHTYVGHLDYLRSVQFHRTRPWILSASDDQTVRLWNHQEKSCAAVVTGHSHYVMRAEFHPVLEDVLVSASMDLTVRVWGIKSPGEAIHGMVEVNCLYVVEGHTKGVNWACLHPSRPLLLSASDDHTMGTWHLEETGTHRICEVIGHTKNVSAVACANDGEAFLSASEDRTLHVWAPAAGGRSVQLCASHRQAQHRYWALAVHPGNTSLVAAGHDGGFQLFHLDPLASSPTTVGIPVTGPVVGRIHPIHGANDKPSHNSCRSCGQVWPRCSHTPAEGEWDPLSQAQQSITTTAVKVLGEGERPSTTTTMTPIASLAALYEKRREVYRDEQRRGFTKVLLFLIGTLVLFALFARSMDAVAVWNAKGSSLVTTCLVIVLAILDGVALKLWFWLCFRRKDRQTPSARAVFSS